MAALPRLVLVAAFTILLVTVILPRRSGEARYAQEMSVVKGISTIHTAATLYFAEHGGYARSLEDLGAAGLIDEPLARGRMNGFRFSLRKTATGYAVLVVPSSQDSGRHTYYSGQDMTIHQHNGREPASEGDPILGDRPAELKGR